VSRCAAGDLTSGTAIESAGRTAPAAHGDCMRESVSDSQRATGGERGAGGLHGDACSLVPRNACPSPSSVRAGCPAVLLVAPKFFLFGIFAGSVFALLASWSSNDRWLGCAALATRHS
jgi:hypothetical protein